MKKLTFFILAFLFVGCSTNEQPKLKKTKVVKKTNKVYNYKKKYKYKHTTYRRSKYNKYGYDKYGFDKRGFDRKGFNKYTGTRYDKYGYDKYGYDRYGYDRYGFNKLGYDRYGYNKQGYNKRGFNRKGIHKDTKTKFGPDGYDMFGYDKEGYNKEGYNRYGYDKFGLTKKDKKLKEALLSFNLYPIKFVYYNKKRYVSASLVYDEYFNVTKSNQEIFTILFNTKIKEALNNLYIYFNKINKVYGYEVNIVAYKEDKILREKINLLINKINKLNKKLDNEEKIDVNIDLDKDGIYKVNFKVIVDKKTLKDYFNDKLTEKEFLEKVKK